MKITFTLRHNPSRYVLRYPTCISPLLLWLNNPQPTSLRSHHVTRRYASFITEPHYAIVQSGAVTTTRGFIAGLYTQRDRS